MNEIKKKKWKIKDRERLEKSHFGQEVQLSGKEVVTNALVINLFEALKPKTSAYLQYSDWMMFKDIEEKVTDTVESFCPLEEGKFYDFIVGEIPLGLANVEWQGKKTAVVGKIRKNWGAILQSLLRLSDDGIALFNLEPHIFTMGGENTFKKIIESNGFYINAVINTPNGIHTNTQIQDIILITSKKPSNELFVGELDSIDSANELANNFLDDNNTDSYFSGKSLKAVEFKSFKKINFDKQILALETQYKEYDSHKFDKPLVVDFNTVSVNKSFDEVENAIYIPRHGFQNVITDLGRLPKKNHKGYYQVVLNKNIILAGYMRQFLVSKLGRLMLEAADNGISVPNINKLALLNLDVPVPTLPKQTEIISTFNKLEKLKTKIKDFSSEVALNPTSSRDIQVQLNNMLAALDELSAADKIREIIATGEGGNVEFKSTLRVNLDTMQKDPRMEKGCLKTIAGFLNQKGGVLLIGVKDDGTILGLDADGFKNEDKMCLHLGNLINDRMGAKHNRNINISIEGGDSERVLMVKCDKSPIPVYLKEDGVEKFYIRTIAATTALSISQAQDYIKDRFDI